MNLPKFAKIWPCCLIGHRIELVWESTQLQTYEAMCMRCGERHMHVLGKDGDFVYGEVESGRAEQHA